MPNIVKTVLNSFWQIVLKIALVPLYKLFLFSTKLAQKYLINNPYLTSRQIKTNLRQNTPAHIMVIIISLFALATNFTTRDTYAEEFNRKSIIAQLLITDIEQEIIEKSPDFTELKERPQTESILGQLSTLAAANNPTPNQIAPKEDSASQVALSQGGEALIKPTVTPFGEAAGSAATLTPSSKEIRTYIVESGDTLSAIASKFNISINTILWENNLSLSSYIRPGDTLSILPVTGITYTIRSGDTLSAIAANYDTTIDKILAFNNLESASSIKARQKLIIPDGKLGYSSLAPTKSIYSGAASGSNFLWPSNSKSITQYYHWRHSAIDIGASHGSPIYAARAGRIERAGWSTGYGYNIVINHGGGIKTLYGHASQLYVEHGEQVAQGEVIGAVGSTGWSTGPHIHFEIIINGSKVNPLTYL